METWYRNTLNSNFNTTKFPQVCTISWLMHEGDKKLFLQRSLVIFFLKFCLEGRRDNFVTFGIKIDFPLYVARLTIVKIKAPKLLLCSKKMACSNYM